MDVWCVLSLFWGDYGWMDGWGDGFVVINMHGFGEYALYRYRDQISRGMIDEIWMLREMQINAQFSAGNGI